MHSKVSKRKNNNNGSKISKQTIILLITCPSKSLVFGGLFLINRDCKISNLMMPNQTLEAYNHV